MMFDPKADPYSLNASGSYDVKPFASYYGNDLASSVTSHASGIPSAAGSPQNLMSRAAAAAAAGYDPMSSYLSMSQSLQMPHPHYNPYNFAKNGYTVPECSFQSSIATPNTFLAKDSHSGKDYFTSGHSSYLPQAPNASECTPVEKNSYNMAALPPTDSAHVQDPQVAAYHHPHTQQVLPHDVSMASNCGDGRKVTSRRYEGSEHLTGI